MGDLVEDVAGLEPVQAGVLLQGLDEQQGKLAAAQPWQWLAGVGEHASAVGAEQIVDDGHPCVAAESGGLRFVDARPPTVDGTGSNEVIEQHLNRRAIMGADAEPPVGIFA